MDTESVQHEMKQRATKSKKSRIREKEIEFKQWVTLKVNNELFAIDALQVIEVQKYGDITPVPNSKEFIIGLINLRGKVITVIDTRIMFSLSQKEPDDQTNIILVDYNQDEMVGFIVDSVDEVINIPTAGIEAAPRISKGSAKSEFVSGVTYYNNKMIICLDIVKINLHITPETEKGVAS
ncbi:MAG: chemotaxis protein CheW [Oceanospirillaceae bacterium]